jgi:hypothetical protein
LQQFDHLPRIVLAAVPRIQRLPEPVEGFGLAPRLVPLHQGRRTGQRSGLALQHIQVVLQIEHLLLAAGAAFMPGHAPAFMTQFDPSGLTLASTLVPGRR